MARVLGSVRLSRKTDESTSPERQREQIETWAKLHGHDVVKITTDTDVSGKVHPFKRPELGPWLTDDTLIAQWDILVTAKLDRATRSVRDLADIVEFTEQHDKLYASVAESIDLSGAAGRMVANVIAAVAQFERERLAERRSESAQTLRALGRWDGGMVPFGYCAVKSGNGWTLQYDAVAAPIARRIVAALINGQSLSAVAQKLNDDGVPPAKYGTEWRAQTISRIATSRTLLGEYGGVPCFPPIITETDWYRLQTALKANSKPHSGSHSRGSMLLRVAFCPCGAPLYRLPTRKVYYRCAKRCSPGIPADELEQIAVEALIKVHGDLPYLRRVRSVADHAAELEDTQQTIAELDAELESGALDARAYARVITKLEEKRDKLTAMPAEEIADQWLPTGQTVQKRWDALETDTDRGDFLRKLGVRIVASRHDGEVMVTIVGGEFFDILKTLTGTDYVAKMTAEAKALEAAASGRLHRVPTAISAPRPALDSPPRS
jgi:DNA invertase Pin-like site-specific DNA recombinase